MFCEDVSKEISKKRSLYPGEGRGAYYQNIYFGSGEMGLWSGGEVPWVPEFFSRSRRE